MSTPSPRCVLSRLALLLVDGGGGSQDRHLLSVVASSSIDDRDCGRGQVAESPRRAPSPSGSLVSRGVHRDFDRNELYSHTSSTTNYCNFFIFSFKTTTFWFFPERHRCCLFFCSVFELSLLVFFSIDSSREDLTLCRSLGPL